MAKRPSRRWLPPSAADASPSRAATIGARRRRWTPPAPCRGPEPRRPGCGALHVGTSGWMYPWPSFYPEGISPRHKLSFYVSRFATVEINSTFYHQPKPATCAGWREQTPPGFEVTLKLHRSITHFKRLRNTTGDLEFFLLAASQLREKLGPILVQLPPHLVADAEVLDAFLGDLRRVAGEAGLRPRVALEPRHPTWFGNREVLATLRRHDAALAFAHSSRYPYPEDEPLTASFRYLRFHGPRELFASEYGTRALRPWAVRAAGWLDAGADVYAYFNNDVNGYAPKDAARLVRRIAEVPVAPAAGIPPPRGRSRSTAT